MSRKKVKLTLIENEASRKVTYKKRKNGLMKKVSELSTLCGIDACAIIYSPYDPQPEVWPDTSGAQRVVAQLKRLPEIEQSKKMENQESFIRERIGKMNEKLKKQMKDNLEKELIEVMYRSFSGIGLPSLASQKLNELNRLIDQKLKEIDRQINHISFSCSSSSDINKTITYEQVINHDAHVADENLLQAYNNNLINASISVRMMEGNGVDFVLVDQQNPVVMNYSLPDNHQPNQQQDIVGHGGGQDMMITMPFTEDLWSSNFFSSIS